MTRLLILYIVNAVATAVQDRLDLLVISSRVMRGYLPDTLKLREAKVQATVDSLAYQSDKLKHAMKTSMLAFFSFMSMLRPLIRIYGKVTIAFLRDTPINISKEAVLALKTFQRQVPLLFQSVLTAYEPLYEWEEQAMAVKTFRLMDDLRNDVSSLVFAVDALVKKPSYSRIIKAREELQFSFMDSWITLIAPFERRCVSQELSETPPKQLLLATRSSLAAMKQSFDLKHWCHRYHFKEAFAEFHLLKDASNWHVSLNEANSITAFIFSNALRYDSLQQAQQFPEYPWSINTFPGDQDIIDKIYNIREGAQNLNKAMFKALGLLKISSIRLLNKSTRLTDDDLTEVSRIVNDLLLKYSTFEDLQRQEIVSRELFVKYGLSHLAGI